MPLSARLCLPLAALLSLAAAPAAARCPATPADTAAGLRLVYADGSTSRLSADPQGLSREEHSYNDGTGDGELLIGRHGYLITQMWPMQDGLQMTGAALLREHPAAELAAPPLAAGETRSWSATTLIGEDAFADSLTFAAGPDETTTIGACSFRARRVTFTLTDGNDTETEIWLYLPDLGISVFLSVTGSFSADLVLTPVSLTSDD